MYTQLKILHVVSASCSGAGFFIRAMAQRRNAAWAQGRLARILPHLIDTLLLASGIALALGLGVTPRNSPWLAAKLTGILVYIGLGMVALKSHRRKCLATSAWIAALVTFAWIVSVALTKDPLGLLARFVALP